jgi:energy-coupling factor transporter ATP-binding protein EcfA2
VILADEPTGNLDEGTRDEIIALLEKLWREYGLTLILVTHDSTVAARAQRIGLMRDGQLEIRQGTKHGGQLTPGPPWPARPPLRTGHGHPGPCSHAGRNGRVVALRELLLAPDDLASRRPPRSPPQRELADDLQAAP